MLGCHIERCDTANIYCRATLVVVVVVIMHSSKSDFCFLSAFADFLPNFACSSVASDNALSMQLCRTNVHHALHSPQRYPPQCRNAGKVGMENLVTCIYAYISLSAFIKIPTSGWTVPAVVHPVADVSLTKGDNNGNCPEQRRK